MKKVIILLALAACASKGTNPQKAASQPAGKPTPIYYTTDTATDAKGNKYYDLKATDGKDMRYESLEEDSPDGNVDVKILYRNVE
ncbi:MAG: hypothetical protein LBL52_03795 [Rickettsiales bacterium]|nr:hypothetical protein [Rickettsiales bacterium]